MKMNKPDLRSPQEVLDWIDEVGVSKAIQTYARDPVMFCRDILRMDPQLWQGEFMQAVSDARFGIPNDDLDSVSPSIKVRFAIKSGTGVGKTSGVACLILWHLACFPDSKIPCTAPTSPQIKAVLWPEIRKWIQKIPDALKPVFPFDPQTDMIKIHANFAVARTAREENPEGFQGFHAKNILLIADEASGVPDAIFLAGQGVMSSEGAITILIGNPTRPSGWFYDAFHSDAHLYWRRTINCTMSAFVQEAYVTEMAKKHGQDSYEFRVRVMGEFHLEDSGFIVPRSWVEAAINREIDNDTDYIIWGVDVSAGGKDKSAIAKRRGNELLEPIKTYGGLDIMQFVGATLDEYYKTPLPMRPDEICVDLLGVGYGYVGRLKEELKQEIDAKAVRVRGINVAERKGSERYVSLRVELWAKSREWFESMTCKIPHDPEFVNEICSVEWDIKDSTGKWFIPDKKTAGKSPDRADAFNLTMAGRHGMTRAKRGGLRNRVAQTDHSMYAIGSASYLNQRQ